MSRSERLLSLIQSLRRRRALTTGRILAQESGVSLRTLYRDIDALRAQGAPIEGEPGLGYVLRPGFTLPPLMFLPDEIDALALGLRWVAGRGDPGLAAAARDALAKIAAVLPAERGEAIDASPLLPVSRAEEPGAAALPTLRAALSAHRKLALDYVDKHGVASRRVVWPVLVGFFDSAQVLAAWCELRDDFRHFRLDRMQAAHMLDERIPRRPGALRREWRAATGIDEAADRN